VVIRSSWALNFVVVVEVAAVDPARRDRVGHVPLPQIIELQAELAGQAVQVDVPRVDELASVLRGLAVGEATGGPAPAADPVARLEQPHLHPAAREPVGRGRAREAGPDHGHPHALGRGCSRLRSARRGRGARRACG
jgi:hypothetical protein